METNANDWEKPSNRRRLGIKMDVREQIMSSGGGVKRNPFPLKSLGVLFLYVLESGMKRGLVLWRGYYMRRTN